MYLGSKSHASGYIACGGRWFHEIKTMVQEKDSPQGRSGPILHYCSSLGWGLGIESFFTRVSQIRVMNKDKHMRDEPNSSKLVLKTKDTALMVTSMSPSPTGQKGTLTMVNCSTQFAPQVEIGNPRSGVQEVCTMMVDTGQA